VEERERVKNAEGGLVMVTLFEALLLLVLGSVGVLLVIEAVLLAVPAVLAKTVMVLELVAPDAKEATLHVTVELEILQPAEAP
jgi:hypothetical protein